MSGDKQLLGAILTGILVPPVSVQAANNNYLHVTECFTRTLSATQRYGKRW